MKDALKNTISQHVTDIVYWAATALSQDNEDYLREVNTLLECVVSTVYEYDIIEEDEE